MKCVTVPRRGSRYGWRSSGVTGPRSRSPAAVDRSSGEELTRDHLHRIPAAIRGLSSGLSFLLWLSIAEALPLAETPEPIAAEKNKEQEQHGRCRQATAGLLLDRDVNRLLWLRSGHEAHLLASADLRALFLASRRRRRNDFCLQALLQYFLSMRAQER